MEQEGHLPKLRGLLGSPSGDDTATRPEEWRLQRVQAFAALDGARLLAAYRLATLILRDPHEGEDAAQEAISRAWASWGSLRDLDRFDAWFDRILVNVCRNRLRHKRTLHVVALDDALELPAADHHGATVARLALAPAFDKLSPDQRIIVVLRYWRDLSIEQIAERLAIPAGTAKSRLHYALQSLRKAIESSEEADR
jgi:RNA polymerase sigma-70 factor (ECF subfamily)